MTHEIVHLMIIKRIGKVGYVGAKLDMSKTYDLVERSYVEGVLIVMRFSQNWIWLVIGVIFTVSYSLVIDGF